MTSSSIRQVQFVSQDQTYAKIHAETGIPVSTLSYTSRGLRDVPVKYRQALTSYYRKEAYARLKSAGLSTTQASRYRWYQPEKVLQVENRMREIVLQATLGAVSAKIKSTQSYLTFEDVTALWQETEDAVKEGLQKSKKPYEDLDNYF